MKLPTQSLLYLLLSATIISGTQAQVITETTVSGGYQSNLFNDSNSVGDKYAALGLDLKYYPTAFTQLSSGVRYSNFSTNSDLSNLAGDVAVVLIPTPESSSFTFGITGNVSFRKFGQLYEQYNQFGSAVGADISYRLTPTVHALFSASYMDNNYVNSDMGSTHGIDLTAGANVTIFGSNSLALRMNYSGRTFNQTATQEDAGDTYASSQDGSGTYGITGLSLRLSRPLSERTGMNLSLGQRWLHMKSDYAVYGYSVDYLSPWAELWDGAGLSGSVKHFFPNQLIAELSVAHYDKGFVDVVELDDTAHEVYSWTSRSDQMTVLSLNLSRPFTLQNGRTLTPAFTLGYRKNQSSAGFFDYEDTQASFSLKIAL